MQLTSPAFANNTNLPIVYTCDGKGVNPPLVISDVPQAAKSLVLVVEDPDAPRGLFIHWVLCNLSPERKEIAEGSVPPEAIQGNSSLGQPGYVVACPPNGQHRYIFKLFALDTTLPGPGFSRDELQQVMEGHILATSELIGLYQRTAA